MINEVLRFNSAEVPAKMGTFSQYDHPHTLERYAQIADSLGLGGRTDEEKLNALINAIETLKTAIGIKSRYGTTCRMKRIPRATRRDVRTGVDDQCTGANPRYPLISEIRQMYLNAYYGNSSKQ